MDSSPAEFGVFQNACEHWAFFKFRTRTDSKEHTNACQRSTPLLSLVF